MAVSGLCFIAFSLSKSLDRGSKKYYIIGMKQQELEEVMKKIVDVILTPANIFLPVISTMSEGEKFYWIDGYETVQTELMAILKQYPEIAERAGLK